MKNWSLIRVRSTQIKTGYLIVEGLNSFATVFCFYYLYFFMEKKFGFGNGANLGLAAGTGAIYTISSFVGGKCAQRFGYLTALKLGFTAMILALGIGSSINSLIVLLLLVATGVAGMSFTWPALEAIVSESETAADVKHYVGVYNIVWAATGALAYFVGGAILDSLGLKSLFYVPAGFVLVQLVFTVWLEAKSKVSRCTVQSPESKVPSQVSKPVTNTLQDDLINEPRVTNHESRVTFLRMAWLANPFAYMAMNTLIAVIPGVARKLELSATMAGFSCSVWCFARLGAFAGLWHWDGWHYRFGWLLTAYLALVGSFVGIMLAPDLAVLVTAQIVFGGAAGLIYYSSLFYSMDVGETKGEHGGIHEAAIGLGNFAGPAVGAAWLYWLPQLGGNGELAVSGLLLAGLGGLLVMWKRSGSFRNSTGS